MKRLFLKCFLYIFLIIITLELIVRFFHLYTENPISYIDDFDVEKSIPNQSGYAVTGNRNQNHSEYKINNFGFNSFREFTPSNNKIEIAIVGDSFIEGFHQDYYDSTGKKIEKQLENIEVYEYGYGGYDLANQLHLVNAYKKHFKDIDYIIFYLKYENDLTNNKYKPNHKRIALLKSKIFKIRDKFKLLSYASSIGIVDPIKNLVIDLMKQTTTIKPKNTVVNKINQDLENLNNFKALIDTFGFNKNKMSFLLNSSETSDSFLEYCFKEEYQIIDFHDAFKRSKSNPTLIYDKHWNNHGRELIASVISEFLKQKN